MRGGLLKFRFTKRLGIRSILANGSPFGMERLYMMVSIYIMNVIFHLSGGHIALAVYGVIQTLHRFMSTFISGSAQTILPIAGMLNAERDVASLGKFLRHAAISGGIVVIAASAVLILFRNQVAALFGLTDGAESELFRYAIVFYAVYAVCLQNTSLFAAWFNASSRLRLANLILFLQELAFLCTLAFVFNIFFGGRTAWMSFSASGVLSLLALAVMLLVMRRRNERLVYPFLLDPSAVLAGNDLSFSVANDLAEASKASERISAFCEESGLTKKQTMLIALSVEEFITLIISNNSGAREPGIMCRLTLGREEITMRIRSRGRMFDPLAYYREHISGDIERSVEIIGLKYIGENAKVIDYRETFGVNNLLITIGRS
jgi:anti-sigma regulatory factor (Ser/Thr protein kinase)